MRSRRLLSLLVVLVSAPSVAFAQPRPNTSQPTSQPGAAERERLLSQAREAVNRGRFDEAVPLLRAAFALGPTLRLRSALAFALFRVGDLGAARTEAEACLGEASDSADPDAVEQRRVCSDIMVRLSQGAGETTPPVATPPAPPATQPTPLPPSETRVESTPPPSTPPPSRVVVAPPPPPQPAPSRVGPLALMVTGGVGLALSGVFFGLRASALGRCEVMGDTAYCPTEDDRQIAERAPTWNTAATASLVIGAAAAVGGVVWYFVQGRGSSAERRVAVGAGGVGIRF